MQNEWETRSMICPDTDKGNPMTIATRRSIVHRDLSNSGDP